MMAIATIISMSVNPASLLLRTGRRIGAWLGMWTMVGLRRDST